MHRQIYLAQCAKKPVWISLVEYWNPKRRRNFYRQNFWQLPHGWREVSLKMSPRRFLEGSSSVQVLR